MSDSRFLRWWWVVPVVALVAYAALRPSAVEELESELQAQSQPSLVMVDGVEQSIEAPVINGEPLAMLEATLRPPEPVQWGRTGEPVPFGQWWSGLATGPGIPALWAKPLLLRMDEAGRADLSVPVEVTRADGSRDAEVTPALFFEFGLDTAVRVVHQGPMHVRFSVTTEDVELEVTMVEGSPFLEFSGSGSLAITVPGLDGLTGGEVGPGVQRFSTSAGSWLLASSGVNERSIDGDAVTLDLQPGVRHVVGPALQTQDDAYGAAALEVAQSPVVDTIETLAVGDDGAVRQTLSVVREGDDAASVWTLQPHHADFAVSSRETMGQLDSLYGSASVVVAEALTLEFPSIPIVWDAAAPLDGGDAAFDSASLVGTAISEADARGDAAGSYFGGKNAAAEALVADIVRSDSGEQEAAPFLSAARDAVADLVDGDVAPALAWEPSWGSVVITPPEFGAAELLNDHHLQSGYWVAAAASVVVADPSQRTLLEPAIDLLIADYAGANVVPGADGMVSDEGVWSGFAGHSWASGVGGFGAGNNLESISESSHAWWAAAKWFLATDRPELAEAFIARLTIESWLTGYEFLPTPSNQSTIAAARPWPGVVWAGKTDLGTWFSASDETALGIRLIPVGPQSFSRYTDLEAVEAASDRWSWCDSQDSGCAGEWWNLLDTDAAVAGRATLPVGANPENTTSEMVRQWWRAHWESSELAEQWSCSPGTTVRRFGDGSLVALVTNPSSEPTAVRCQHEAGDVIDLVAEPRSGITVPISVDDDEAS